LIVEALIVATDTHARDQDYFPAEEHKATSCELVNLFRHAMPKKRPGQFKSATDC
jgi:hypothetical protein